MKPAQRGAHRESWWRYKNGPKRGLDLVFAILLLPMLLPMIALLYLCVRRSGVSGFYGHRRFGRQGRTFHCWKLRTMVNGAERKLTEMLACDPVMRAQWQAGCKLSNDPRITPFGRWLRRTGLDELPQIWNVLRGEMSFVGPRPVPRDELRRYGKARVVYESLRPGITGLWQVSGRNALSYAERVALDVQYAGRVSFNTDVVVLLRTFVTILARNGC